MRPPDDERSVVDLLHDLTMTRRATLAESARLGQFFAAEVLPDYPTRRVYEKHAKHVEDDLQWPEDTSADEYLDSLRATVLNPRSGVYLVEAEVERTWTIYFVGPVPYRSQGRRAGSRIVVLFNAERHFWITGFQAEAGDIYVDRQAGFWVQCPR